MKIIHSLPFGIALLTLVCLTPLLTVSPAQAMRGAAHQGRVITKLPVGYKAIRYGKMDYFFHGGHYYRRGPSGFLIVAPPVGIIISTLPTGYVAVNVGEIGYFYYQDVYYRQVPTGYLVVEKPLPTTTIETAEQATVGDKVTVFVDQLNLRSGPDTEHPILRTIRKGAEMTVKGTTPGWYFVQLTDGISGWVMARHTRKLLNPAKG